MKYEDLPARWNKHVIVDTRSGVTFLSDARTPNGALATHVQQMGEDEYTRLSDEDKKDIETKCFEIAQHIIVGDKSKMAPPIMSVVQMGPFVTSGGTIDQKNSLFISERYMALVSGDERPGDLDHEIHGWLVEKMASQKAHVSGEKPAEDFMGTILSKLMATGFRL